MNLIFTLFFLASFFNSTTRAELASPAYLTVSTCYPELLPSKKRSASKVDLRQLKEAIDEKYPTSRSILRFRRVKYQNQKNESFQLTLFREGQSIEKATLFAKIEKMDSQGSISGIVMAQQKNPTPEMIRGYLRGSNTIDDESSYVDIKPSPKRLKYTEMNGQIKELELSDKNKILDCSIQSEGVSLCQCNQSSQNSQ